MKKITLLFVAMLFAMTAFAADLTGGMKLYFDFTKHALWNTGVSVKGFFEQTNQRATKMQMDGSFHAVVQMQNL